MTSIREAIRRRFAPAQPLPAGVYHYQAPANADFPYRLHLRLEADGNGILIVNAATVLHLNQTAAEFAYHLVNESAEEAVVRQVAARYKIAKDQVVRDYDDFKERIFALVNLPDLDPVTFLDFERDTPYSGDISAPYRLDCALTYTLPEGADPNACDSGGTCDTGAGECCTFAGAVVTMENFGVLRGVSMHWPLLLSLLGAGFVLLFFQRQQHDPVLLWLGTFFLALAFLVFRSTALLFLLLDLALLRPRRRRLAA